LADGEAPGFLFTGWLAASQQELTEDGVFWQTAQESERQETVRRLAGGELRE